MDRNTIKILLCGISFCLLAITVGIIDANIESDESDNASNPAVSAPNGTIPRQQLITNVVGIKVESHPDNRAAVTLVVLTAAPSLTATDDTVPWHRMILVRADASVVMIHTNRAPGSSAALSVDSNDDCGSGTCSADRVEIFLHSLDELH